MRTGTLSPMPRGTPGHGRLEVMPPARESRSPIACGRRPESLVFFSTISTFGTAVDVTLAELSIEAFYPANAQTALAPWKTSAPLPAPVGPSSAPPRKRATPRSETGYQQGLKVAPLRLRL
jgi:hypothetical protein